MSKLFDTVFSLPYKTFKDFLVLWFTFVRPITGLTEKESLVASEFTYIYFKYLKEYKNEELVYEKLFKSDVKKKVSTTLGMSLACLTQHLIALRKKGVLVDNKFHKNIIPPVEFSEDMAQFKALLLFNKQ